MSYEQQFFLKRDEELVRSEGYDGNKIFWYCSQRDLEPVFRRFGTSEDEYTITFTPLQAMKLMAAISRDLIKIVSEYSFIYEGFDELKEYEQLPADKAMLEAYSLLTVSHKTFTKEEQFNTLFYKEINSEYPIKTLIMYAEKIGEIVNEMTEEDILVLKVG